MVEKSAASEETRVVVPAQFSRNIGVLTESEQYRLLQATVAIVGLGCTGCAIAEFLARAGVGGFSLVDGDRFDDTNINRQLYAKRSTLGQFKVLAAKDALLDINSEAKVNAHAVFLDQENATGLLDGCNLVINGLDDPAAMIVLHRTARALDKPSVFLLSGSLPFQGVCTTFPSGISLDYETLMGLPTAGRPLGSMDDLRCELFDLVTKARVQSALRRGAIPGQWVAERDHGGPAPSFGVTSNITALIAAFEAIKTLICRPGLEPVSAPSLIMVDCASSEMVVRAPESGAYWFQGDF